MKHSINIPLLLHTWENSTTFNYSGNTLTDKPLKFKINDISARMINMSLYAKQDEAIALDLSKAIRLNSGDEQPYYTPTDELIASTNFMFGLFGPSALDPTIISMMSMTTLMIIVIIGMGFKLHKLQLTVVSMCTYMGKAKADDGTLCADLKIHLYVTWAMLALMLGILFMHLMKLFVQMFQVTEIGQGLILKFKRFMSPSPITSIILELSTLQRILYIPVISTHFPPSRLLLAEEQIKTTGMIVQKVNSYLTVSWPSLEFVTTNGELDIWLQLPNKIRIPMFRSKVCQDIVGQRHFCRYLADYDGIYVFCSDRKSTRLNSSH
jgi:hypothetical protein